MSTAPGDDDSRGKRYDARLVRRLFAYVRPHRRLVAGSLVLIAVESGMQLVGPLLTRWTIDKAFPARDSALVGRAALLYVAVLIGGFGAAYGETVLTSLLGQRVMQRLRTDIFARFQRLPIEYFDRTPVGRQITRVTSDVEALNELFTSGVVAGLGDLFTLLAISVAMLLIDWRLALAAFAVIPFVYLASRVFQSRVRDAYREIRTRLARLNAFLQERLSGIRVVQLFGREPTEEARFEALNASHLDAHMRSITVYALYFPVIEFLTTFALGSLLLASGSRVSVGALTVGTVAAFLQLVRRFFQPLQDLSEKFNILQAAMAASERIFAVLDTPEAPGLDHVGDTSEAVRALRQAGVTVEFQGVWFAYGTGGVSDDASPRDRASQTAHLAADARNATSSDAGATSEPLWVLRDVSFVVRPGETLALVGHTGAGKSTIVNLLLRFYDPVRGRILLNGVDTRELPIDVLRSVIGYVQQDIFLFAGDVASNLRMGSGAEFATIRRAAERVGADRVIDRLPRGWDEQLAERGASVSVGERQLLAFARAMVADPALLVLDEATSAVDSEIEAEIQSAVAELMDGRTTIAIAHRLSTIIDASEILVLHHGEVVERGAHAALVSRGGLYERLYRLQVGDQRDAETAAMNASGVPAERMGTIESSDTLRLPTSATFR